MIRQMFVFLFAMSMNLISSNSFAELKDDLNDINTQMITVGKDLESTISLLNNLTLDHTVNKSGEDLINQTIKNIAHLESQIGDQSSLYIAIDKALTAISEKENQLLTYMKEASNEEKQTLLAYQKKFAQERDKIYSYKGVVMSFQRTLEAHKRTLNTRKKLLGLELDLDSVRNARVSIENVVKGLEGLSLRFKKVQAPATQSERPAQ